jgi:hypothetical protein
MAFDPKWSPQWLRCKQISEHMDEGDQEAAEPVEDHEAHVAGKTL